MTKLQDLVLVAGHAAFKSSVSEVPENAEPDAYWVLQQFQIGEPPFYLEHIRRGVVLAANNPVALLVFSGGRTRYDAGQWSEVGTYHAIAASRRWWIPDSMQSKRDDVANRTTVEDFARDSFENLLFGICRFQRVAGSYPRIVTVVSWAFKAARFDLHRGAIAFPKVRFNFVGVNEPIDLESALRGEKMAIRSFIEHPFGTSGDLAKKRASRNPFGQEHGYRQCPGLKSIFDFMDDSANAATAYAGPVPWHEGTCAVCGGTGRMACSECNESGHVTHDLCRGTGSHLLDPGDCYGCQGTGWVVCPKCGGHKTVACECVS